MSELFTIDGAWRSAILVCGVLSGCSVLDGDSPRVAAAIDNLHAKRTVTVYLVADPAIGYLPTYHGRVVTAEPVTTSSVTRAEARKTVQGISTIIVGDSCESVTRGDAEIQQCTELESTVRRYGEIETTSTTDREGFAVLELGVGEYRISMKSWQTAEDKKCSWSGSELLPESSRVLELPVLVFCE